MAGLIVAVSLLMGSWSPQEQAPLADARALLAWHLEQAAPPADSEDAAWRAYVYLAAGADGEARAAAARLDTLDPGSADSARFRVEADTRSPLTRDAALRDAEAWLAEHGGGDDAAVRRVEVLRDFLREDRSRRDAVSRADARAGWLPLLSLLTVGLLAWGVRRGVERGWL
jgi:hypothetical protein